MELCKATSFAWTKSFSSSLHTSQSTISVYEAKRYGIWCMQIKKDTQMVVSVTGATGFIGTRLVKRLHADQHKVHVLTRSRSKAQLIFPGKKVVDLINSSSAELRPKVLVSATAVGYYGTSETKVFDEKSPPGNDYLAEVCNEWEGTAIKVNKDVRLALIRIGVVLGKEGGALAKMIPMFRMFAGGPLGSGRQWFSWIHIDDIVNLIYEALSNPSYEGVINGTAPNPVRLGEMCDQLGSVMGRPSWLPVPDVALKVVLGEGAKVVLEGQNVVPLKAQELGFPFRYPYMKDALRAIMSES